MNLDQVNKLLTLVANLAVVAGIVVVAFQLKQNTDAIRVQSAYDLNVAGGSADIACMGDDAANAMITSVLNPSELTNAQMMQMWCEVDLALTMTLNSWIAYGEGRASQAEWNTAKSYFVVSIDYDFGRVISASYKVFGHIDPLLVKEVDEALRRVTE